RLAMERRLEDYYGPGRSICVYRGHELVPRSEILVADLAGVTPRTRAGHVTIDPEVGRIAFPARHVPEDGVYVTYSRLGIGAIGGGGFARPLRPAEHVYRVAERAIGAHRSVGAALKAWRDASRTVPIHVATIEIIDDGVYEERFEIELRPGERLEIRAAQGRRPILIPAETPGNRSDRLRVRGLREEATEGAEGSGETQESSLHPPVLVLDGIWIARRPLELSGHLGGVTLRHCTLVPAGGPPHAGSEQRRQAASLIVEAERCPISVHSSVLGRIRVDSPESGHDPIPLTVTDSILDASVPGGRALHGADERPAWVVLSLQRVTVLGGAHVHSAALVEDSILTAPLECERRQRGTIRYSYIPVGSHTPRRSRCQPDDGLAAAEAAAAGQPAAERLLALDRALHRLRPSFDNVAFGDPAYARLASGAAPELTAGAHDEGELGAYHGLWQALRLADLTTRLEEFTPAGADIDIRFAS
ncbi:MAG TPA: hypothetical protein VFR49_09870, partial [Solirubrobacteraceae bacterium]|nr:hypothetical protein [Solirubrobacteraceae bacterium]